MYNYEIGYSDYEGNVTDTICHEKQFSRFEFDSIMVKAYAKAIEESGTKDCNVSYVYDDVKKILWTLGFNPVPFLQRFVIPDVIIHEDYLDEWDGADYRIEVIRHTLKQ